jgi:hypothetical protein
MRGRHVWIGVALAAAAGACAGPETNQMQALAEQYVKLVLAVGQHDADYVDAFYGPPEWRTSAVKRPLAEIDAEAAACGRTGRGTARRRRSARRLRHRYLTRQLEALRTRVAMLGGKS